MQYAVTLWNHINKHHYEEQEILNTENSNKFCICIEWAKNNDTGRAQFKDSFICCYLYRDSRNPV
jgi:hypothetical protein